MGEGRPFRGEGRSVRGEGRPFGSEGRPVRGEGRSFGSEGRPNRGEGRPNRGEGRPIGRTPGFAKSPGPGVDAGPRRTFEPRNPAEERDDIIYGRNPVIEALRGGRPLNRVLLAPGLKDAASLNIRTLAREAGVLVEEIPRDRMDLMTGGNHQGIIAQVAPKAYAELDDLINTSKSGEREPLLLILDEIEDPRNLGAILRTADAAGAHGVVIPQRRAVGLTETVAKSSAGAIEYVPVAKEVNLVRTIETLKKAGFWIGAVDMDGDKAYYEADLTGPIALVIGGEGKGVGRLIKEKCDFVVSIPMLGSVGSLNASVAASIVLYDVVRQRAVKAGR